MSTGTRDSEPSLGRIWAATEGRALGFSHSCPRGPDRVRWMRTEFRDRELSAEDRAVTPGDLCVHHFKGATVRYDDDSPCSDPMCDMWHSALAPSRRADRARLISSVPMRDPSEDSFDGIANSHREGGTWRMLWTALGPHALPRILPDGQRWTLGRPGARR